MLQFINEIRIKCIRRILTLFINETFATPYMCSFISSLMAPTHAKRDERWIHYLSPRQAGNNCELIKFSFQARKSLFSVAR